MLFVSSFVSFCSLKLIGIRYRQKCRQSVLERRAAPHRARSQGTCVEGQARDDAQGLAPEVSISGVGARRRRLGRHSQQCNESAFGLRSPDKYRWQQTVGRHKRRMDVVRRRRSGE